MISVINQLINIVLVGYIASRCSICYLIDQKILTRHEDSATWTKDNMQTSFINFSFI